MQGYVLIAIGTKYIDEAHLLAQTIRRQDDKRPINVIIKKEDLHYAIDKDIFTDITIFEPVNEFYNYCNEGFERYGTYPKINLYHYTRFEENIFLDTDVLCQYSPDTLWDYLSNREQDVTMLGVKNDPSWHWGTINEVSNAFGKHVPHVHGGFLYFRKSAKYFFDYCNEIAYRYDELKCKRFYRGGMCDEIIFALAHSHFNYMPVEFDEKPIMTFNYNLMVDLPSKLQTHNNTTLDDYIPFVHMYDRTNFIPLFLKIMK